MPHPSCSQACVAEFGLPTVPEVDDHLWMNRIVAFFIGVLVTVAILLIAKYIRRNCRKGRYCWLLKRPDSSSQSKNVYYLGESKDKSEEKLIAQNENSNESAIKKEQQTALTVIEMEGAGEETNESNTVLKQGISQTDPRLIVDINPPNSQPIASDRSPPMESTEREQFQQYSDRSPRSRSQSERRRQSPDASVEREFPNEGAATHSSSSGSMGSRGSPIVISPTSPEETSRTVTSKTGYAGH